MPENKFKNGSMTCPLDEDFDDYRARGLKAMNQIDEIHGYIQNMSHYTHHLSSLSAIAATIDKIEQNLVGPATGRKQVPTIVFFLTVTVLTAIVLGLIAGAYDQKISMSPGNIAIEKNQPK